MSTTERQPLPWFAFNVGEYVKDTMRLRTESHGAYLLLMLDYYGTAKPCPDDDFVLAAVAKLSDEAWKMHRKVLAPFFDIRDGHWFHKRIEREITEACEAHAARIASAEAAAQVRWGKKVGKPAAEPAKRRQGTENRAKNANRNAPRMPTAMPEDMRPQSDLNAHKQKHPSLTEGGEEPPPPKAADAVQGIGTPVPATFQPNEQSTARALEAGLTVDELVAEVRKFIGRKASDGAFSHDWQGSFAEWLEREIKHRKKAPPRIEVNAQQDPATINWGWWLKRWKADQGSWSFKTCGPEPGMAGCRVPIEKLIEHGIVTGETAKEPAA